ncbi:phosphatidate cytidylyltransferase [Amphritea balenae]|uniref:Phosphatidate cytidylyltransferase n=1 Tax=Amphritea balenae TaxID=452629 RepID=A0A3P1SNI5_9GAMM|nr:phosphatidate cytidylyltransferase [Amphritea balenae]RRC98620.1 phosphatidate cytidylyltransferase [Amphritea balenae]GGK66028.1 phosphatidate cytidylyltransferase [Amphritea balenae]
MLGIPLHSFYLIVLVLILLICGSLIRYRLEQSNPEKDYTELRERIQSWWVMVGLLFAALLFSQTLAIVFFGFLSFLALKEFLSIVPTRQTDRRVIFWAYLSIPIQYYWVSIGWYGMFIIFIPVYIFLLLPIRMVLLGETKGFIRSAGILHWATMLTVFAFSHIAYLLVLPVKNEMAGYIGPVLFLLFMTQFNDVCQYIWGKKLGRHRIIPKVSPNKTWEGFLGGVATITLVAAITGPLLTPLLWWQGMLAGMLISVSGFFGDLVISSVKRDLQIKDTGNLIPGHGGILDRMDSLIFTAPLFFHFLYYSHY